MAECAAMGNGFAYRDEEEVLRGTMESSMVDGTSGVCHTVCRVSVMEYALASIPFTFNV